MEKNLVPVEQGMALTPEEVIGNASTQAKILMDIVEKTGCYQTIANKKYLQVEAWETIGAFNRTHAETESITPVTRENDTIGYQANVRLWKDGIVVGGAIMPCYFTENCCKGKEGDAKHKACMSAAQTFATSKAYRMNFSYVAILAGYQPLPADEITEDMRQEAVDKTQHYCAEHDTAFFMKGKMKSHAHPIEGTDPVVWCHEHTDKKEKAAKDIVDFWPESDAIVTDDSPKDEHPVTPANIKELTGMFKEMGLAGTDVGTMIRDLKWTGIKELSDLKVWQFEVLRDNISKQLKK